MTEPAERPQIDATIPSNPRVYSHMLGGKDTFASDRALAEELLACHPGVAHLARVNRRFILAGAEWVAAGGIAQFIDLGCGLAPPPLDPALHDAAREGREGARVVYVDRDPMVKCHADARMAGPGLAAIRADVTDPETVLGRALGTGLIDPRRPACIVLGATLSSMSADVASRTVAGYMGALVRGSYAVISCVSYDDDETGAQMQAVAGKAGEWHNHSLADVTRFFGALRVEGGQVRDVRPWCWPRFQEEIPGAAIIGGIGIKP